MRGSFQVTILRRKMSAYTSRLSFSAPSTPGRLYASTTIPAVAGTSRAPLATLAICSSVIAASLAPKSTAWATKRCTPSPLPTSLYSTLTSGFCDVKTPIHCLYSGAGNVAPAPWRTILLLAELV